MTVLIVHLQQYKTFKCYCESYNFMSYIFKFTSPFVFNFLHLVSEKEGINRYRTAAVLVLVFVIHTFNSESSDSPRSFIITTRTLLQHLN